LREVVKATVLEGSAEGQVFEPAIGSSYVVEAGFGHVHRWRNGRKRSGVVRTRSAAARRVTGAMECRLLCRRSSSVAEMAVAKGIELAVW